MGHLRNKEFLVVSGKGGVGRTTVCAALALAAAKQGRRVLVAQAAAAPRLNDQLGFKGDIGPEIVSITPQISAVNMTPQKALAEYGQLALRSKTLAKAVFDNKVIQGFFRAVPGLDAYAMLGKAFFHTPTKGDGGARRFDLVILDAPASGHAITMLKVPSALLEASPLGPLAGDAQTLVNLMKDREKSGFIGVAFPWELPVTELLQTAETLSKETSLGMALGVLNAFPPNRTTTPPLNEVLDPTGFRTTSAGNGVTSKSPVPHVDDGFRQALCIARDERGKRLLAERMQERLIAGLARTLHPAPQVQTLPLIHQATLTPETLAPAVANLATHF